jgi:cellulose synthase/poly-beta-1,6-N-acetylglucosamine synthase-like glycosyltransferase
MNTSELTKQTSAIAANKAPIQSIHAMVPPFVSVIIPALNCAHEVDACITALRAQDYPSSRFEVIVADNGSTDGTAQRVEKLGGKVVHRPERGRSRALNAGLTASRGDIILTTDMGCIARPDWISKVAACFADPQVGCVGGEIEMIHSHDNLALRYQARNGYMSPLHAATRRQIPFLPFADGANASFRRAVFEEIGGFEESFFKSADVEICYRLLVLTDYKILFCPDCVMEEAGEPDLKALLQQRYRMGMGSNLMRARFPEFYVGCDNNKTLKQRYWSARETMKGLTRFFASLASGNRPTVEDAVVRYLMGIAQSRGARHGARHLQLQSVQPAPVNGESLKAFMARMDRLDERIIMKRVQISPGNMQA